VVILFEVIKMVSLRKGSSIYKTIYMLGIGENFLFVISFRNMHTYFFTPWSGVLLENPIGSQLVKKFPAF
jgi:hypothetical protein